MQTVCSCIETISVIVSALSHASPINGQLFRICDRFGVVSGQRRLLRGDGRQLSLKVGDDSLMFVAKVVHGGIVLRS